MKICFIYYKYPLYLNGSYFQEFLNKLAKFVDKVYLIATRYPKGDFEKPDNLKIYWVTLLKIRYFDEMFFMFACLLRAIFSRELYDIDIVNVIGPRGLLTGWYLKKRYKIPLVCTIEMLNEGKDLFNAIYYRVVRFLLLKIPIDKYVCWSNYYWKEHLGKWGIPEEKVEIIPCGIDTDKYSPSIDGGEIKRQYAYDKPLIVFAKPLYHENTEAAKILVRSIAVLRKKREVKLLIGGGDGWAEVEALARELDVADLVNFMPPTKFTDIPKYIAAADLIVFPFIYAPTTSRSLLEAMAMGKPIITISVGELKEFLKDRENVVFSKPEPKAIADAINELLENDRLCKNIGRNALKTIRDKFDLGKIAKREVCILERLVHKEFYN